MEPDMKDKVVVVTRANSGYRQDDGRRSGPEPQSSWPAGTWRRAVRRKPTSDQIGGSDRAHLMQLDLASQASIRRAAYLGDASLRHIAASAHRATAQRSSAAHNRRGIYFADRHSSFQTLLPL